MCWMEVIMLSSNLGTTNQVTIDSKEIDKISVYFIM